MQGGNDVSVAAIQIKSELKYQNNYRDVGLRLANLMCKRTGLVKGLTFAVVCMLLCISELCVARADYVHEAQGYQIVMSEAAWKSIPTKYSVFQTPEELLAYAEKAINSIAEATGEKEWMARYRQKKVRIATTKGASHTEGGYGSNKTLSPVIHLKIGLLAYNIAPVIHELTHIVCQGYTSISLREGLACYLNDQLGGFPTVFNAGQNAHLICRDVIDDEEFEVVSSWMGRSEVLKQYEIASGELRNTFYVCAQSFATYLIDTYGIERFMKVYNAPDEKAYEMYFSKNLDTVRREWIDYLNAYEGQYTVDMYNQEMINTVVERGMDKETAVEMLTGMGFYW